MSTEPSASDAITRDDHQLLTVDQVARDWLCCSRAATYELVLRGALRSVKIGRMRRVPVGAVREYVASLLDDQSHGVTGA